MSILETVVHYLDSKRLQKLTGFISSSSPSFGSPLCSRNPPISSMQKVYAAVMTLAKPHLSSAYVSRHVSRDEIYQAFLPLFVLQVTKAGRGGLGTRLCKLWLDGLVSMCPWLGCNIINWHTYLSDLYNPCSCVYRHKQENNYTSGSKGDVHNIIEQTSQHAGMAYGDSDSTVMIVIVNSPWWCSYEHFYLLVGCHCSGARFNCHRWSS